MQLSLSDLGGAAALRRWGHTAVALSGGRVAVFGGFGASTAGGSSLKRLDDVVLVDAVGGGVVEATRGSDACPAARERHAAAASSDGAGMVVFGGRASPEKPFGDAWSCRVDGRVARWSPVAAEGEAPAARWSHALLRLPGDGADAFLAIGGRDASGPLPGDAHVLELELSGGDARGAWSRVDGARGPLLAPTCCGATRDGQILVFGGGGGADARRLDAAARAWAEAPVACDAAALRALRRTAHATAPTDADGQLLVVGGVPQADPSVDGVVWSSGPSSRDPPPPTPDVADATLLGFDADGTLTVLATAPIDAETRYPVHAAAAAAAGRTLVLGGGVPCFAFGPVFGASFAVDFAVDREPPPAPPPPPPATSDPPGSAADLHGG